MYRLAPSCKAVLTGLRLAARRYRAACGWLQGGTERLAPGRVAVPDPLARSRKAEPSGLRLVARPCQAACVQPQGGASPACAQLRVGAEHAVPRCKPARTGLRPATGARGGRVAIRSRREVKAHARSSTRWSAPLRKIDQCSEFGRRVAGSAGTANDKTKLRNDQTIRQTNTDTWQIPQCGEPQFLVKMRSPRDHEPRFNSQKMSMNDFKQIADALAAQARAQSALVEQEPLQIRSVQAHPQTDAQSFHAGKIAAQVEAQSELFEQQVRETQSAQARRKKHLQDVNRWLNDVVGKAGIAFYELECGLKSAGFVTASFVPDNIDMPSSAYDAEVLPAWLAYVEFKLDRKAGSALPFARVGVVRSKRTDADIVAACSSTRRWGSPLNMHQDELLLELVKMDRLPAINWFRNSLKDALKQLITSASQGS